MPVVVDVREEVHQLARHRAGEPLEAKPPRLAGERVEEGALGRLVLRAHRANDDRAPVGKAPLPREMCGILHAPGFH